MCRCRCAFADALEMFTQEMNSGKPFAQCAEVQEEQLATTTVYKNYSLFHQLGFSHNFTSKIANKSG